MHSEQQKYWLTLFLIPGIGSTNFIKLIARFGSPYEVLSASEKALSEVVGKTLAHRIAHYREVVDVDTELKLIENNKVKIITLDDPEYPVSLAEIYDPPLVLYCKGNLLRRDQYSISIVGTRKYSPYGSKVTHFFAQGLVNAGFTIVSGLASGIDTIAHQTALDSGGRTVAFLGCGIDVIYPRENKNLYERIQNQGAVISTFPMQTKPLGNNFPIRNRFISGFSLGTIVTEATRNSGALITAQHAVDQGKTVFAVPGPIGSLNSEGPHGLIRQGAKLAEKISDIIEEIPLYARENIAGDTPDIDKKATQPAQEYTKEIIQYPLSMAIKPSVGTIPSKPERTENAEKVPQQTHSNTVVSQSPLEKKILSILSPEGSYVDEVAISCQIPISQALSTLTLMEMKGWVKQFSGKRFAKA